MGKEYETKVLEINVEEVLKKLKELGAEEIKEKLMKRWVFDMDPSAYEWIRLREEGEKTTMTYKYKTGTGISETEEIEIEVNDFEKAALLLHKLNFKNITYHENKRIIFILNEIEFAIDTWPKIPTYLEIESKNEEKVKEGLKLLGLVDKDIGNVSVKDVYKRYNIDLDLFKELKFD